MPTKTFKKEFLQALLYDDLGPDEDVTIVSDELIDTGRWSLHYDLVFKVGNQYFSVGYSRGATESQDESPFEYESDDIVCDEVFPVEVKRIEYVTKPPTAVDVVALQNQDALLKFAG